MKRWIVLVAVCVASPVQADIYKCKDAEGHILYQEKPCPAVTMGKIQEAPSVSEEDRKRAQENLDRLIETNRKQAAAREQAWQQEQALRLAEQEQQDRQQAEKERLARLEQERYFWSPWFPWRPWFHQNRFNQNRHHPTPTPGTQPDPQRQGSHQDRPASDGRRR